MTKTEYKQARRLVRDNGCNALNWIPRQIAMRQHTPEPWSVEHYGLSITMAGQVVAVQTAYEESGGTVSAIYTPEEYQ